MAETISQVEAIPEDYPTSGSDAIWQRIEAHCAHRWTPRQVVWIVDGPGHWRAPLTPVSGLSAEVWKGGDYEVVTLEASPMGGLVLTDGTFKITGTVGADNDAPEIVLQAYDRLRGYVEAELVGAPGAYAVSMREGQLSQSIRRSPEWMARAMNLSGAADLLRNYRRA